MSYVWEHSPQSGTALLVLLAIADIVNDDDLSGWPGVSKLAKKARISERYLQKIQSQLIASGEMVIHYNEGARTASGWTTAAWRPGAWRRR